MKNDKIRLMCLAGLFAAVVFVFTAYFHIPSHTGYTHVGDAFIYLAACLLPRSYAIFVGAGGALLADCLTGFAVWAPGSVIIKSAAVMFFSSESKRIVSARNLMALIPASLVCIGGYYLYESLITGNYIAPLAGIPGYAVQSVLSSALFAVLGLAFDKLGIKKLILRGGNTK